MASDEQKYLDEWYKPKYELAKKSGNSKTLLKFKAYWCLKPSDSFIVLTKNDFNVEEAKRQQTKLKTLNHTGTPVKLVHADNGMVTHEFTDALPITEFPVKSQSKDAPPVIYEFPMESPPYALYVAGVDPYRQGKSAYSSSLGSVYIYKRITDSGYPFTGFADHGVSEALYLNDPDGNGVELYWDKPKEQWPQKPDGTLDMYTKHLDIESLLSEF